MAFLPGSAPGWFSGIGPVIKKWTSRLAAGASVALVATTLTNTLTTGAAYAGPNCSGSACSEVGNVSNDGVTAVHNWTCDSGTTGTANTGCAGGDLYYLSPGAHTPANQDWDVVRVDAGWCYKIKFIKWWGKVWTVTYNRIGLSSPTYVKVEDASYAEVQAQSASSCP